MTKGYLEISCKEFTVKTPLSPPTPSGQAAPKVRGEARNSCSLPLPWRSRSEGARGGLGWGKDVEHGEKDFGKSPLSGFAYATPRQSDVLICATDLRY
jgi:hypothetical protein